METLRFAARKGNKQILNAVIADVEKQLAESKQRETNLKANMEFVKAEYRKREEKIEADCKERVESMRTDSKRREEKIEAFCNKRVEDIQSWCQGIEESLRARLQLQEKRSKFVEARLTMDVLRARGLLSARGIFDHVLALVSTEVRPSKPHAAAAFCGPRDGFKPAHEFDAAFAEVGNLDPSDQDQGPWTAFLRETLSACCRPEPEPRDAGSQLCGHPPRSLAPRDLAGKAREIRAILAQDEFDFPWLGYEVLLHVGLPGDCRRVLEAFCNRLGLYAAASFSAPPPLRAPAPP